jgi:protein-S-isoprenylcysteine O-methyltransferase Ste14
MSDERSTRTGLGRVLVFVYGIFAVAATARALVQLATDASKAPIAYSLSLFSGLVYIAATWALATEHRRLAMATIVVELTGVLVIGTLSHPDDIDKASVWSDYGNGYGYVPLVLPLVGLWWLFRLGRSVSDAR